MSGTFKLDGQLFPVDPIRKRWSREEIASSGVGESIFPAFWRLELEFPTLHTPDEVAFFYDRWTAGGLHTAVLPHPRTGQLVGFTGVNIPEWAGEMNDVDSNAWSENPRLVLGHISMRATGTM